MIRSLWYSLCVRPRSAVVVQRPSGRMLLVNSMEE